MASVKGLTVPGRLARSLACLERVRLTARSLLDFLDARPLQSLVLVGIFILACFSGSLVKPRAYGHLIVGDGISYYAWLRSSVVDFDWDFRNDYTHYNELKAAVPWREQPTSLGPTPTGLAPNVFAMGSAVLWLPFFLIVHLPLRLAQELGFPVLADGFNFAYDVAVAVGSVFYATASAILVYLYLRTTLMTRPGIAAWAVITIWLASPLFWYSAFAGPSSHAPSAFAVSLLMYLSARYSRGSSWRAWVALGAVLGLAGLVRWQDLLFAVLLLPVMLETWRSGGSYRLMQAGATVTVVTGIVFTPQALAWMILYGSFITVPQGTDFLVWSEPHFLEVLFSPRNGLFVWTPVALAGFVGILMALRRYPRPSVFLLAALLLQVYVNSVTTDWWGGAAFGARRLSSSFPALAFGVCFLGVLMQERRDWRLGFTIAGMMLIFWNMALALQHILHTLPEGVEALTYQSAFVDKFWIPYHLIRAIFLRTGAIPP